MLARIGDETATGCREWLGAHKSKRYGTLRLREPRMTALAHRASYALFVAPVPPGRLVLHKCDNPPCVNPEHLFLGTHGDNAADASAKGRLPRGDDNPIRKRPWLWMHGERGTRAKLTDGSVLEIRRRRAAGETARALGAEFGVRKQTIEKIERRERWKHI